MGSLGGEEEALDGVSQAGLAGRTDDVLLMDDRNNGAADQVPVVIQRERDHRLDIERVPPSVVGPDAKIKIVLERHTDERGDWIGELLCQCIRRTRDFGFHGIGSFGVEGGQGPAERAQCHAREENGKAGRHFREEIIEFVLI